VVATGEYSLQYYGGGNSSNVDKTYIPCNPTDAINVGQSDFTIEFWVRCSASLQDGTATAGANYSWIDSPIVFDRDLLGSVGSGGDFGISLTDGRVTFGIENSGGSQRTIMGTTDLRDDVWHHVAVTRVRSSGDMAIYVDGTREANQSSGPSGDVHVASNSDTSTYNRYICLGGEKHALDWPQGQFAGYIDEMRISNSLRYTGTSYTVPAANFSSDANTVGLFHFNEGTGTTVNDDSGNNNNGSFTTGGANNGPTWSALWPFANVTVTPAAVTAVAANVTPTVVLGSLTIGPTAVSAVAANVSPTVVLGSLTITPTAVSAVVVSVAPTVILGALSVTPVAISVIAANVSPTAVLGSLSLTPAAASAVAASIAPTVILGALVITPTAVSLVAVTIDPTIILGSLSIAPAAISVVVVTVAPTVEAGGNITITPAAVSAVAVNVAPTAVLGALTLSPGAVALVMGSIGPTVIQGAIVIIPNAVSLVALTINPTTILSGWNLTPAPAGLIATGENPVIAMGSLAISPGAASVAVVTVGPTVAGTLIAIISLTLRARSTGLTLRARSTRLTISQRG
jgi:hypothetical protein